MDIEKLAEITANEFGVVYDRMDKMDAKIDQLVDGQKRILEVVLELPSKKVIEKLVHKVEDIDERVTVIERKIQIAH